MKKKKL